VGFDSLPYFNVLHFEGGRRWARVLAETEDGAMKVARYYHYNGSTFELLEERLEGPKE
jgi:hypothetical protein